jgi:hypothetical protein
MADDEQAILTPAEADNVALAESRVVPGRACGTCTLCCKVIGVAELDKQPGTWCPHCVRGKGCGIYAQRPVSCRTFFCLWMTGPALGPEWKPERAKFALVLTEEGRYLTAFVDPGFPSAWQKSPYYEMFKTWAREAARQKGHVVSVRIGARAIIVLPEDDIDVGVVAPDETIRLDVVGGRVQVRKLKRALQN